MSDSIKFGPEWLRNMSNDTGGLSTTAATSGAGGGGGIGNNFSYNNNQPRYPLAEYRYGREEMLSLYDKNFKLPELLPKFNKLFIEKMQSPLALLPPTADEETPRGITPIGGLTSERSGLGLSSNSSSGSVLSGSASIGSLGISGRGIRGSSIDRGRGRARGGLYHSSLGNYQRSGFIYDEDARGVGSRGERSWSERNGNATSEAEWTTANSGSSPRKDFSALRSSGSSESWRRSRVEDDGQVSNGSNEGWRTSSSTTNNSTYKWPVRSTSWRGGDGDAGAFNADGSGPSRLERSKSIQGSVGGSDSVQGNLRRFGMNANASWDEDNLPEWAMDEPIEGGGSFDATGAFLGNVDKNTGEKLRSVDGAHPDGQTQSIKCDGKLETTNSNGGNEKDISLTDSLENTNSTEDEALVGSRANDDVLTDSSSLNKKSAKHDSKEETEQEHKSNDKKLPAQQRDVELMKSIEKSQSNLDNVIHSLPTDRMQKVAEDIEKLIMDDDHSCAESDDQILATHTNKHAAPDDVLSEKTKEKDLKDLWYYRDPQGKVQGPFTATEMLEWYRAGYFDETLNVRRVCDPQFLELGELLKACSGTIPFVSMPIIPPLLQNNTNADINLNVAANVHPASPTKPLTNLVHNSKIPAPQPTPSANQPGYYDILQSQSFMNLMNAPPNDYLMSNTMSKHPSQNIASVPNALSKQAHLKNQQQTQSLQHLLNQHKKDFNAPDGANANNVPIIHPDPMQRMLTSISLNHQQQINPPVLPVPPIPQPSAPQNSSFQSLMMQLHTMQKPHIMQQQIQQHHQQSIIMNALNSSSLPRNHHSIDEINQPPPQIPHQTDVRTAHGLWDLPIPPPMQSNPNTKLPTLHNNIVSSSNMKTELQIIEHLRAKAKQDVTRLQFPQFCEMNNRANEAQLPSQPPPPQVQVPQVQPVNSSPMVLGNAPNDLLVQQSDIFRAKNDNIKDIQSDALKQVQIGKVAKIKTETSTTLKTVDTKTNQIQNNKVNNNLIEQPMDELQMEKTKARNLNAAAATKQANDMKTHPKANAITLASEAANKSNNNNIATATAPKSTTKESTKKKAKDKEQKVAEEKRRQQEEEERQHLEEKKRLELIAAQRKAKLVDQNAVRNESASKRNNLAASVAPWSNISENASSSATNSTLTLTEIQKAERERRAELFRLEQAQQQNQALLEQQQQKESVLKWQLKPQSQPKSFAEIQAEESKKAALRQSTPLQPQQKQQNTKKDDKWPVSQWSMIWGNDQSGNSITTVSASLQSGNGTNCFWEDPTKSVAATKSVAQQNGTGKPLARSQTVSNMQTVASNTKPAQSVNAVTSTTKSTAISKTSSTGNVTAVNNAAQNASTNANSKKAKGNSSTAKKGTANTEDSTNDEFGTWCCNKLAAHVDVIDVPTFVSFLRDIESPFEIKDYIRMYLGETKECSEFAKHFLERRCKYKNQQRAANAHIDDMCSPAPAITPASESQEAKGKGKKEKKKNKMTKLDSRILGFSVTSAEDRLNVGARDYARDGP